MKSIPRENHDEEIKRALLKFAKIVLAVNKIPDHNELKKKHEKKLVEKDARIKKYWRVQAMYDNMAMKADKRIFDMIKCHGFSFYGGSWLGSKKHLSLNMDIGGERYTFDYRSSNQVGGPSIEIWGRDLETLRGKPKGKMLTGELYKQLMYEAALPFKKMEDALEWVVYYGRRIKEWDCPKFDTKEPTEEDLKECRVVCENHWGCHTFRHIHGARDEE